MSSRIQRVRNWEAKGRIAQYRAGHLSRLCDVSLRQLERHFHDIYGIKLKAWLMELRLRDGKRLLADGTKSIKEVALELQYKQSSHFSREFKKHFLVTPAVFMCQQHKQPWRATGSPS